MAGAAAVERRDRFGLGWRPELAAGILAHLDRVDVIEVIAEDYFGASRGDLRALRTLAAQVRMVLHGVSLGLASTLPVERKRLDRIARLIDNTGAEAWSEHLAFVRAGGIEIGHLAAPPRSEASVEGACRNLEYAARIVGCAPLVENIATLVVPPTIFTPMPSTAATTHTHSCAGCRSMKSLPCISVAGVGSTDRVASAGFSMTICTTCRQPSSSCCASSAASLPSR